MKQFNYLFSVAFLGLLLSCASVPPANITYLDAGSVKEELTRYPVIQGVTDTSRTQLAVFHSKKDALDISLWDSQSKSKIAPTATSAQDFPDSDGMLTHLQYAGLVPDIDYWLQVRKEGKLVDLRRLRALDTTKTSVQFAIASCMDDEYAEQKAMWNQLAAQKPELIFMIGDNVYADKRLTGDLKMADPPSLWRRYSETRQLLEIFKKPDLIPVFATWDDHDYGKNDGDKTYPHKEKALEILNAFFPRATVAGFAEIGPGAASHLQAFGQDFILMDSRSFRSSPMEGNIQSHWGADQEHWLWQRANNAKGPIWLMNGDQFFGAYHKFESYEGRHPQSFAQFLKKARQVKSPLILVSGDRHLSELQKISPKDIGYTTYELTSSAIHAKTYTDQWKKFPNKRKLDGKDATLNYMIVSAQAKGRAVEFTVTAYGPESRVLYTRKLSVKK